MKNFLAGTTIRASYIGLRCILSFGTKCKEDQDEVTASGSIEESCLFKNSLKLPSQVSGDSRDHVGLFRYSDDTTGQHQIS